MVNAWWAPVLQEVHLMPVQELHPHPKLELYSKYNLWRPVHELKCVEYVMI